MCMWHSVTLDGNSGVRGSSRRSNGRSQAPYSFEEVSVGVRWQILHPFYVHARDEQDMARGDGAHIEEGDVP